MIYADFSLVELLYWNPTKQFLPLEQTNYYSHSRKFLFVPDGDAVYGRVHPKLRLLMIY